MPGNPASDKIHLIEGSLACYARGWLSLIPLLGFLPAFLVLMEYKELKAMSRQQWNAAYNYLRTGFVLSLIGVFLNLILMGGLILLVIRLIQNGVLSPEDVMI
ncbi:MAG TPA: hypothetical protein VGH19_01025 [Verrucomicrobiae bacterium]